MAADRQKRDARAFKDFAAFGAGLRAAGAGLVSQTMSVQQGETDVVVRAAFVGTRAKVMEIAENTVQRWRSAGWAVLLASVDQPSTLDLHEHEATFYLALDGRRT